MRDKTAAEKKFDKILRRMLQSKPVSREEVSAKIQAERRAGKGGK
jgi:hypothetical protein